MCVCECVSVPVIGQLWRAPSYALTAYYIELLISSWDGNVPKDLQLIAFLMNQLGCQFRVDCEEIEMFSLV